MSSLPPDQQTIKEILDAQGIPSCVRRDWDFEYLSVSVPVGRGNSRSVSARFGLIPDGVPALTELPRGRYLCVRIPYFYLWWDDLNKFPQVLREANSIACSLLQRDAFLDFFIDYADCDTIFFRMEVPLNANEALDHAVLDVYHQLTGIAAAVYAYLETFNDEYKEKAGP